MHILLTGGAGYIGTELVRRLLPHPDVARLTVYDNLSRGPYAFFFGEKWPQAHKLRFVRGELLDSRQLQRVLDGVDVVYHLAARVTTPFADADAHAFDQVNHWGTAELAYALETSRVQRLIFTSSTSVYGASPDELTEASEPQPHTMYGLSKLRAEAHLRRLEGPLTPYLVRCGNVYGYSRSMRFDAVINRFLFDAHCTGRLSIHGNGQQWRAFINVEVVADVLAQLAFGQAPGGTYNLVTRNLQIMEIVDALRDLYPELEFLFINQHAGLRELRVSPDTALRTHLQFPQLPTLHEELAAFKAQFAF